MSTDEKVVHDVVLLAKQGMSRRAISRALAVGRNTVHDILEAHESAREIARRLMPCLASRTTS